jgi:hypothetical protein
MVAYKEVVGKADRALNKTARRASESTSKGMERNSASLRPVRNQAEVLSKKAERDIESAIGSETQFKKSIESFRTAVRERHQNTENVTIDLCRQIVEISGETLNAEEGKSSFKAVDKANKVLATSQKFSEVERSEYVKRLEIAEDTLRSSVDMINKVDTLALKFEENLGRAFSIGETTAKQSLSMLMEGEIGDGSSFMKKMLAEMKNDRETIHGFLDLNTQAHLMTEFSDELNRYAIRVNRASSPNMLMEAIYGTGSAVMGRDMRSAYDESMNIFEKINTDNLFEELSKLQSAVVTIRILHKAFDTIYENKTFGAVAAGRDFVVNEIGGRDLSGDVKGYGIRSTKISENIGKVNESEESLATQVVDKTFLEMFSERKEHIDELISNAKKLNTRSKEFGDTIDEINKENALFQLEAKTFADLEHNNLSQDMKNQLNALRKKANDAVIKFGNGLGDKWSGKNSNLTEIFGNENLSSAIGSALSKAEADAEFRDILTSDLNKKLENIFGNDWLQEHLSRQKEIMGLLRGTGPAEVTETNIEDVGGAVGVVSTMQ